MALRPSKNFFFGKMLRFDPGRNSYSIKTEVNQDTTSRDITIKAATNTSDAGNILPPGWACRKDGANALVFLYNNTPVMKIGANGEITSNNDIGAFGSV